jgi:ATP-dependent helicase/DNAse subunit B
MSYGVHDRYSGRLSDARLIEWVADKLGPNRVWSASQFNEYGICGFRFFAKRLLRLESLKDPEEGMDSMQRGTVIHAILETTYRRIADEEMTISPYYRHRALALLHESAEQILEDAPARYGFRASPLWEQEKKSLLRLLDNLVDMDFSDASLAVKHFGDGVRSPYRLEMPFSSGEGRTIALKISDELEPLRVTGYIDRMDRHGDRVIVVDYKSGSAEIPTAEMRRGRNFQMMLYLHAVEQILADDPDPERPTEVAGGFFWHLSRNRASGVFQMHSEADRESMRQAAARLTEQILAGRAGDFAVHPNKSEEGRCYKHCDYSQMCRISIAGRGR